MTEIPGQVLAGTEIPGQVLAGTEIPGQVQGRTEISGQVLAGTEIPVQVLAGTENMRGAWNCTQRFIKLINSGGVRSAVRESEWHDKTSL